MQFSSNGYTLISLPNVYLRAAKTNIESASRQTSPHILLSSFFIPSLPLVLNLSPFSARIGSMEDSKNTNSWLQLQTSNYLQLLLCLYLQYIL